MSGPEQIPPPAGEPAPAWRTAHTALVLDLRRSGDPGEVREVRLLVTPVPEGGTTEAWGLPRWMTEGRRDHEDVAHLTAEARSRLGLDVVVLRSLEPHEDEARRELRWTLVLERREADPDPPPGPPAGGGRWVTHAELETLTPQDPAQWALAGGVLDELAAGAAPARRPPWAAPGWFAAAAAWMVERLRALERPPAGPVEQVRSWCISSVLRAPTAAGDVYLKAPSAHFRTEVSITRALAERFPESVPRVLASDAARAWLLLEDVGPALRRPGVPADVALWERALCRMGELQRACVGETGWLLAAGCADRRLARLRAQIPALLDAPETRAETGREVLARLTARVPELQAACDALAGCGVPETLLHGDRHPGNVGHRDGRLTLFDWTDAAVGHPFVDLLTFLPNRPRAGVDDPAAVSRRLLDAYLEGWTGFAPPSALRRAVALLQVAGRLYHAQSYLQILRSVEGADYWQFRGDIASWLVPVDGAT
jgi:hypothetical protein